MDSHSLGMIVWKNQTKGFHYIKVNPEKLSGNTAKPHKKSPALGTQFETTDQ